MKKIIEFNKLENGKYKLLTNDMFFETDLGTLKLTPKQALEIAYTLFDSYGLDYDILNILEEYGGLKDESNSS